MTERTDSIGRYFLAGLAVGWLLGIFFAPKSGEEFRDYLSKRISRGHRHARKKAREFRERAEDLVDRGKEMVNRREERIPSKLDEAGKARRPEKSKAKGA